jgi:hypothetical protein
MSFSLTTEQVRNRTKTVTRRFGWWILRPGDRVMAIEKGQGLKKGEKVKYICEIEIVSARREQIKDMPAGDCMLEGFMELSVSEFVEMLCNHAHKKPTDVVNRIEFKYV